jgi:osmotically inducible lipoprotein OsmB
MNQAQTAISILATSAALLLGGCAGMSRQEVSTVTGATVGAVAGAVVGGTAAVAAGAVIGGVVGHEAGKK